MIAALGPSLVLVALALLVAPGPVTAARRLAAMPAADYADTGPDEAPGRGRPRDGGARREVPGLARRRSLARPTPVDPWQQAGAWDQLAACLRSGLALEHAVRAVAASLPGEMSVALTRVADLAALGADPADAWEPALAEPGTARLARAARRSARSGAAVAEVARAVAADVRAEAGDAVTARAERAGVLVAGPLGLCFLPAFLALGIAPVVLGLATPLLERT